MKEKIRVHGKAMNRTALGIANAYLVLYPNATLKDLNHAFPGHLNGRNRCETIFVDVKDAPKFTNQKNDTNNFSLFFFEKPDEILHLKNGQKVAMQEMWTQEDFDNIVTHAKKYGILVASFEKTKVMQRGTFELEYLNGFQPTKSNNDYSVWLWIILALVFVGVMMYFLTNNRL